jgi:hypothetical protein
MTDGTYMTYGTYKSRALALIRGLFAQSPRRRLASTPAGVPGARGPWFHQDSATLRTGRRRGGPDR